MSPDELLVEVRVPKLEGTWGVHYEKFNRVAQAWSIVGVAAAVRRDNGSIAEARIGLTNMGSTPVRATSTEAALAGTRPTSGRSRRPRSTRPTARARGRTSTPRPTTASTSRGC